MAAIGPNIGPDSYSGGNVGVGTPSPSAQFHIFSTAGGPTNGLRFGNASIGTQYSLFAGSASPDAGYLTFGDGTGWKFHIGKYTDSGATKFLTIRDNGNVGIGISAPPTLLSLRAPQGPVVTFERNSVGADGNEIGKLDFWGQDLGGSPINYGQIVSSINWAQGGNGEIRLRTRTTGTLADAIYIAGNNTIGVGAVRSPGFYQQYNTVLAVGNSGAEKRGELVMVGNVTTDGVIGDVSWSNDAPGAETKVATVRGLRAGANNSGALAFLTMNAGTAGERLRIDPTGRVGIGTTAPLAKLHVEDTITAGTNGTWYYNSFFRNTLTPAVGSTSHLLSVVNSAVGNPSGQTIGTLVGSYSAAYAQGTTGSITKMVGAYAEVGRYPATSTVPVTNAFGIEIGNYTSASWGANAATHVGLQINDMNNVNAGTNYAIRYNPPNPSQSFVVKADGLVGIGTSAPSTRLHVVGDATITGTLIGGNIQAKYQDVAEWVSSSTDLADGTVVVLDPTDAQRIAQSSRPYDQSVAGVISPLPGLLLGEAAAGREKVATFGRVRVKAEAFKRPIRMGDLLVTSDVPGRAMASEAVEIAGRKFHQPGTILGKALEPLPSGVGEILVLLSLQ